MNKSAVAATCITVNTQFVNSHIVVSESDLFIGRYEKLKLALLRFISLML